MTDFRPESSAGEADLPSPIVHAVGSGATLPPELESVGTTALLLVGAVDREWAAGVAIELCRAWALSGRRVVLADLHLEQPRLHERLGVENLEGIVDVFLYGASISRSAKAVPGQGFYLIPAGTYDADAGAIYRHPRWSKLVAGFREAHASLVVFAPAETAELEAASGWLGQVVLLGVPKSGRMPAALASGELPLAALVVPPGYHPPSIPEPDVRPVPPGAAAVEQERELFLPPDPVRARPSRRSGGKLLLLLLLVALLLAAAGFALARYRPDLVPWLATGGPAAAAESEPAQSPTTPAPVRAGDPVPFAVLVKSYASLSAARQQVQVEERRFEGTPFYISPEDDAGVLYYKVYAGLLRDTASAERLRERLLEAGAVDSDDTLGALSLIHRAHLAFDLGEYPTREAAAQVGDSLAAQEVPAYAVAVPYDDGSRRWQLYGGAYRDSAAADALRRRLTALGESPRLVLRIGEPVPAPQ